MTAIVRLGYWSCPKPPCEVRYQVRMAPNAMDFTVPGSCSASVLECGAFGLTMFSESHAAARIRAAQRPDARGALLIRLIATCSSEGWSARSKVDLREAREGPEVGVREAVKPERVGVAR